MRTSPSGAATDETEIPTRSPVTWGLSAPGDAPSALRHRWVLVVLFLLTAPLVNPYIRGDGNGYYSYVRSLAIDGDLHFENEYRHGDPAFQRMAFDDEGNLRPALLLPNRYVRNQWAVGPSLLWAPFFLVAHGLVWILNALGATIPADGYAAPYRWLCALGTACYAFIGLLLAHHMATRLTGQLFATMATVGIWFASSLPVYMYFLPFHVHALSSFVVSVFLWYWLQTRAARSITQWVLWGLMAGLMVQVYYLNGVFLIIPLFEWIWGERGAGPFGNEQAVRRPGLLLKGLIFTVAGALALTPHFIVKWIIHGSPLKTGYGEQFFWTSPRLWQVGFSSEHGMFLWTPILLPAVIGLAWLWSRASWEAGFSLATFALLYYAVASYQNWHGISAYGSRFFVSFTPVFVLGLAALLEKSHASLSRVLDQRPSRTRRLAMVHAPSPIPSVILGSLILWNVGFIFQWGTNLVPNRGPVDFREVVRNQIVVVPHQFGDFIVRYLRSRQHVTRQVEREDLVESRAYRLRR